MSKVSSLMDSLDRGISLLFRQCEGVMTELLGVHKAPIAAMWRLILVHISFRRYPSLHRDFGQDNISITITRNAFEFTPGLNLPRLIHG